LALIDPLAAGGRAELLRAAVEGVEQLDVHTAARLVKDVKARAAAQVRGFSSPAAQVGGVRWAGLGWGAWPLGTALGGRRPF
jgi:hypothetical protein